MSTQRWQELDRIFAEARQLPPGERNAFVARACGGDDALRAETLWLLEADRASGEFLERPALDTLARALALDGARLAPGERLGAYTIVERLGSGGMGEVWRARDERLRRDVAIKVLLPQFTSDADRLRRFAEEARTAGALNHPSILTVYDVGEHDGLPFLVSEYLEGKNLRERLIAGPVPVDEAVAVALSITRGLAVAHARGIIHRDLKPENIFLRSDGGVKILDFGLAKLQPALQSRPGDTMTGVILGTAGYMAPEQVNGEPADARADLFAVGVMLYEMVARRRPFQGTSVFETLHAVVTNEPDDIATLAPRVSPALAHVVMRLLKKAPDARFQTALDLAWALEQLVDRAAAPATEGIVRAAGRGRWAFLLAAPMATALLLVAAWTLWPRSARDRAPNELTQFTWTLPGDTSLDSVPAVSPDGRRIAFVGKDATGSRLYIRDLGSLDATRVPGTDHARHPFWSPDGGALGFFAEGRLLKIAWPGGAPVALAQAPFPLGGAWSSSNEILFGPDVILAGLKRVSASGGDVESATAPDLSQGDNSHAWPVFLPDGIHFLYFVRSIDAHRRGVYLGRLDRPADQGAIALFRSESDAVYVPRPDASDGDLLYVENGRIEVRRFDAKRSTVAADARTLGLTAGGNSLVHPMMLSASPDVLAFADG